MVGICCDHAEQPRCCERSRLFVETLSALSILMMHLSRFCEDLIVWSSAEFGFVELSDAFSTGSSMMPQKKNPDSLDLFEARRGAFTESHRSVDDYEGCAANLFKDMQEDKEPLFDALDTAYLFGCIWRGVGWNDVEYRADGERGRSRCTGNRFSRLSRRQGLPFAMPITLWRIGPFGAEADKSLTELTLEELQRRAHFSEDVYHCSTFAHRWLAQYSRGHRS